MKDRIPKYPGRVRLVPVAGQENVFDLVRADEPTQEGTPINKATLLTDEVAALFGLSDAALPNDVFAEIWRRNYLQAEIGSYVGTGGVGEEEPNTLFFAKPPLMIAIVADSTSARGAGIVFVRGQTRSGGMGKQESSQSLRLTWGENSVSWYTTISGDSYANQMNTSNVTYYFVMLFGGSEYAE